MCNTNVCYVFFLPDCRSVVESTLKIKSCDHAWHKIRSCQHPKGLAAWRSSHRNPLFSPIPSSFIRFSFILIRNSSKPAQMLSIISSYWSSIWSFVCYTLFHAWQILCPFFIQRRPLSDVERNAAATETHLSLDKPPNYVDSQLMVQYQSGLDIVGVGVAGQVYNVDDYLVLKACRIYEPPSSDASPRALWDYASETIFHCSILKDEKTVLRLLTEHPHPNIIGAVRVDYPEGIYLRKYQPLSALTPGSQSDRIFWYQDIIRALLHLHKLGIAHSDIRKDNILFDQKGHAFLSDFGASCPFGHPNPSLPVLFNGPSETVSDATDQFAMASLIYELETGSRPEISFDDRDGLVVPQIHTAHDGLDSLIENAWRGQYNSTADMLKKAKSLNAIEDTRGPVEQPVSKAELIARIAQWRKNREMHHGNLAINKNA